MYFRFLKVFILFVGGLMFSFRRIRSLVSRRRLCSSKAATPTMDVGVIGHLAAIGSMYRIGGTIIHCAVCIDGKTETSYSSNAPLTVDFRIKAHAQGIIPANNRRREDGNSEDEILFGRVVDRSVRARLLPGLLSPLHLTVTVHAIDDANDFVVAAVNAACFSLAALDLRQAALEQNEKNTEKTEKTESNVEKNDEKEKSLYSARAWGGLTGCARIGLVDGALVLNPAHSLLAAADMDLLVTATEHNIIMLEGQGREVPESVLVKSMELALIGVREAIVYQQNALDQLRTSPDTTSFSASLLTGMGGRLRMAAVPPELRRASEACAGDARELFARGLTARAERSRAEGEMRERTKQRVREWLAQGESEGEKDVVNEAEREAWVGVGADWAVRAGLRECVLSGRRADGRAEAQLRPLEAKAGTLGEGVHGSATFARGDTRVLASVTLGSRLSGKPLSDGSLQPFFLHYDFPAFGTGQHGGGASVSAVNRRVLGHGRLAEKSLAPLMPDFISFPYSVRVVAEVVSSSGSSSMASVCAGSLALMDAGVLLSRPAAGVSVGLVYRKKEGEKAGETAEEEYTLLTDILGTEDHFGDMDFKVAGTLSGVTGLQLDVKLIDGVPVRILEQALARAREGRAQVLEHMGGAISRPGPKRSCAPHSEVVLFESARTPFLMGPGGETRRYIEETYAVSLDCAVRGLAIVSGARRSSVRHARALVEDLVLVLKEGDIVPYAEVLDVRDFGVFVKLTRAQEALLHISEISHDSAIARMQLDDLLRPGQRLRVQVTAVDHATGMVKVSRKRLLDPQSPDPLATLSENGDYCESKDENDDEDSPAPHTVNFPTAPLRPWSPEYFKHNVADEND